MTVVPLNEKAIRLIQYINELSQLKQKPIASYKKYEEVLWVARIPNEPECKDAFRSHTEDWLYVKKPVKPIAPTIPAPLQEWLTTSLKDYTCTSHNRIVRAIYEQEERVEKEFFLKDFPVIQQQIQQFKLGVWEPYAVEAQRVQAIQQLYDQLFVIHQNLHLYAESLELVVSIGLLQWNKNDTNEVERHLLTSKVELHFNRERAEFIIQPAATGNLFEYEEDMLLVEDRLSGDDSKEIQTLLATADADEAYLPQMAAILTSIAHALDSQGTYMDTLSIPSIQTASPIITLSPAFILRKKTQKSFQQACHTAVEQLALMTDDANIPNNLANMLLSSPLTELETTNNVRPFIETQEFYFPLPSNEEQSRIISTLNKRNSVLVQGPPGTGKTHTIANLTAHLLATGQRVLITSQTAKALSVLKSKLPTELQDLAVNLLGGDSASMKDLEKVVHTISINKEQFNLTETAATVLQQEETLKNLKRDLNSTKTELLAIREAETYVHQFNPIYNGTAQQIADKVNERTAAQNWYTTNVTFDTPDTFAENEKKLVSDYIHGKNIPLEAPIGYEQFTYPTIASIPDVSLLSNESQLKAEYDALKEAELATVQQVLIHLSQDERDHLKEELQKLKHLQHALLFNSYPALHNVLRDIFSNRGHLWEEIVNQSASHLQTIQDYQEQFDEQLITTGSLTTALLKKMAEDLQGHVASGGNLGNFLIKPKIIRQYTEQLKQVTYNGAALKSNEHVQILHAYAQSRYAKEQIQQLLIPAFLTQETIHPLTAFSEFQNALAQLTEALRIQNWRNELLQKNAFLARDDFNEDMVHAFMQNIDILALKENMNETTTHIENTVWPLKDLLTEQSHPLYQELIYAIDTRNADALHIKLTQYKHFQKVVHRDNTVHTIFTALQKESPTLAISLEQTVANPIWVQRLATWQQAFEWKQTQHWIQQFSAKSESTLSRQYDDLEKSIKETTIAIGTAKAWMSMLQSMTDTQSKHLKAWAKSVKSIGKGTGKNAARYRADAQKHMEQCIDAIPAWIMPLHQVYDNFEIRPHLFDVIIIDEASQSWHDALLLNYLAKKLIIVGDDQQISPTIIGIQDEDILKLQNKFFKDIDFPFGGDLNLKTSFFDISYIMFKDTITLREHFRCMPEIIGFSNLISYRDKPLMPLRQYPANRLDPIKSVYLPHGVREGSSQNAYNEVEADAIVQEIKNCIANPRYGGKTFGVISLLGANQAKLIQSKLLHELGAELMEERKIICGDAYAFQGDERDIIFLSMVVANGITRITATTDDKARQRFNVAASRAKDQLWLMHSITVNDIGNKDCLRYQLLSYVANPLQEETESNRAKCESNFERHVFDAITAKGYRVIPQYNAANYRIDLVVQGEKSKLAVECDGDHWHTSVEDRERDFLRERILQRAGWTFWRVLGSTYYNNPEKALHSLWAKIEEMGIQPYMEWHQAPTERVIEMPAPTQKIVPQEIEEPAASNPTYNHYKRLLEKAGFTVLEDLAQAHTLYILGTESLRSDLAYRGPRVNSFVFHPDGLPISGGQPVWSLTLKETSRD